MQQRTVVLGTHNQKKRLEMQRLLIPVGIQLLTLDDFPDAIEVVEDGDSFAANATLKATQQAVHLKQWVIGEDSGLAVDALQGAPGIYSARFSGEEATDESNNAFLLEKLSGVPHQKRTAHYVCHMTLSDPAGQVLADSEDRCNGVILEQPRGTGGFGYDPLFEIPEYHRTFGEMGITVKSALSHRARASRKFVADLIRLIRDDQWPID
ncbi:MAG: non-canonical purine NTP pyrophosphatase, RdgB/HAM1 family [Blastopirellula sp.]|nr:MAG: non-canonical purine NTP pyrophosphatase, RdgB/HAM1 family [Blastopirellula sp.]